MKVIVTENIDGFEKLVNGRLQELSANGLSTLAFAARKEVKQQMASIFRQPKPITLNSVMVRMADASKPISEQFAEVYIRDDIPGASTQPDKYLLTEEHGGERASKRSEHALQSKGFLLGNQQFTPGPGATLDSYGQLQGGAITQLLSRVGSFQETGFDANATSRTKKRLAKKKLAVKVSGTDYFVAKSKLSEGFMGVFKLAAKGKVTPVLWFTTKTQIYRTRFPFRDMVAKAVRENFKSAFEKAARYVSRSDRK